MTFSKDNSDIVFDNVTTNTPDNIFTNKKMRGPYYEAPSEKPRTNKDRVASFLEIFKERVSSS